MIPSGKLRENRGLHLQLHSQFYWHDIKSNSWFPIIGLLDFWELRGWNSIHTWNLDSGFQSIVNLFPGTTGSQHIITLHFSEYLGKSQPAKDSVAQLIADSTEKKFRFNSLFKGIWKKKQAQYSLDT